MLKTMRYVNVICKLPRLFIRFVLFFLYGPTSRVIKVRTIAKNTPTAAARVGESTRLMRLTKSMRRYMSTTSQYQHSILYPLNNPWRGFTCDAGWC